MSSCFYSFDLKKKTAEEYQLSAEKTRETMNPPKYPNKRSNKEIDAKNKNISA